MRNQPGSTSTDTGFPDAGDSIDVNDDLVQRIVRVRGCLPRMIPRVRSPVIPT